MPCSSASLVFIDREAGEIIRLVASMCLCVCAAKGPMKQKSATLLKHHRVLISRNIQNVWAFKMVVVSTRCAIAVDHAFNF